MTDETPQGPPPHPPTAPPFPDSGQLPRPTMPPHNPQSPQVVYALPPRSSSPRGGWRWLGWLGLVGMVIIVIGSFLLGLMGGVLVFSGQETELYQAGNRDYSIAIVPVEGLIDDHRAEWVVHTLRQIREDKTIKAVVLRVNSPGGYVTPSDEIADAVRKMRNSGKPVVASYGSVAASGGYYCSVLSDEIFAEPTTVTGSIGVIGEALVLSGLLDKVGIDPEVMVAQGSPKKRLANQTYQPWTDQDREQYQVMLDWYYDKFLQTVKQGRGKKYQDEEELRQICNGLAYPADKAVELKLVDKIGYLRDAIEAAAKRINTPLAEKPHVVRYREPVGLPVPAFLSEYRSAASGADSAGIPGKLINAPVLDGDHLRLLAHELSRPRAMYLMN